MRKTFKYRCSPTKRQQRLLGVMLEQARLVYNQTLAVRKETYAREGRTMGLYETQALLPRWKAEHPLTSLVHSQVLQNVQVRVDVAFQAFFRRVKAGEQPGYPRFKGEGRYDSLTYPQYGIGFTVHDDRLHVSKVGDLKTMWHRPLEGTIKTLTLHRTATGKWYACFSVECERPAPLPASERVVGVDVGLSSFATLSTGEHIANPRFFRQDEQALAKAQRRLAKAEKGTSERRQRRQVVAHVHERIRHRRSNFAHHVSRQLVSTYQIIAFEDLSLTPMLRNHCLAKSIADAAWSQLVQYTTYKAADAGRVVILVDPRHTSQRCSRCGLVVPKTLRDREHQCVACGLILDRDHNAAINILRLGLQSVGFDP